MPHYDYECEACGYKFECFQSMSEEPVYYCPVCSQPKVIRLIGMGLSPIIKGTKTPCYGGRQRQKRHRESKIKDRLGEGENKGNKPFWRDGPVNKNILKNPEKYVKSGKVD